MAKITITKSGQGIITIPKEIMELKKWDSNTEILICPFLPVPIAEVSENTPIVITEMKKRLKNK